MTDPHYTEPAEREIDVTGLIGSENDAAVEDAFTAFQAAHEKAAQKPCVRNWRSAVAAYDAYAGLVAKSVAS